MKQKVQSTSHQLWKERLSYGISDFACNLVWNVLTLYMMFFYTDVAGITSAAIGTMIMVTRLFDSFADMFTGVIIDKTHSRWGKSLPYIFFGSFPLAIFGILLFCVPNISMNGKLIYAYITYLGISICYGLVNIPISSVLPNLTRDPVERTNMSTVRMVFSFLGATFVSVATLPLVKILGGANQQKGFVIVMSLYCISAIFILYIPFKNLHEIEDTDKIKISVKLSESFHALFKNKPWLIFAFSTLFMWASNFFVQGSLVYYFTYVIGSTTQAAVVAGLINFVPMLGTIVTPFLVKYMIKRNVFILGSSLAGIGLLVMLFGHKGLFCIYLGSILYAFGHGIRQNMYFSMQADPVDYSRWQSGINLSGLISAINGFIGKLAMAITSAVTGLLLSWGQYAPHHIQTMKAIFAIKANFILLPFIMIILSIIVMCFYNLDKIYSKINVEHTN